ncbi:alpha/beta hydrolase [Bradyrhizobium sp. CB2312]|uniref:alpha/beta fold hydrolase n=1 Tax=Bradyrhizobium sp. CB2312 TaxID=3039155 RepID=UPI0024B1A81A|nr:alpha/beta hydrolase [Bradyrhizobium sp. CB2312]WFU71486.1 alpha/beta hydrolase [Bradyrhizobium sp. CB2312]
MRRLTIKRPVGPIAVSYHGEADASRPPILFVHPINLKGGAWAEIVPAFADRFTIVPDMRGFGDSPPAEQYDLARWAQDCIDAVDRAGIDRFHAIGGSLGGAISVYLAAAEPKRVLSVVAVGSQLYSQDPDNAAVLATLEHHTVDEMFELILPKYALGPNASAEVVAKTIALRNPNEKDDIRRVWRAACAADIRAHVASVSCPVTVLTGEFDLTCPLAAGAEMAAALRAPHVLLPGIGHLPMLEDPPALIAAIKAHLAHAESRR